MDFRKRVSLQDDNTDNLICGNKDFVKSTQGKWINILFVAHFYVEGRKIKIETANSYFTLTDEFISDERAQEHLDQWMAK